MKSNASAIWNGDLKKGKGEISTESGALRSAGYSFGTRFEGDSGLNPEELIAAAHAGCYSMALSNELSSAGYEVHEVTTEAEVTLSTDNNDINITGVHLKVNADVGGIDDDKFQEIANGAKEGCPVSRVLKADITMNATLKPA